MVRDMYVYDNGRARLEFVGRDRDWYVWHVSRQQRLATYRTRRDLLAAYERCQRVPATTYGLVSIGQLPL